MRNVPLEVCSPNTHDPVDLRTRPVLALAAMLRDPSAYQSQMPSKTRPEDHDKLDVPKNDFFTLESEGERAKGLEIVEAVLGSQKDDHKIAGVDWYNPGEPFLDHALLVSASRFLSL